MKCLRPDCPAEMKPGEVFCPPDWKRLPRYVRQFILVEQREAKKARRLPGKKWETTLREATNYLHTIDLADSLARAKPLTLTADKGLVGRLADQVLGRVKDAKDFRVVVLEDGPPEPVFDGDRVFVRSMEALRKMLTSAE